MNEELQDFAKQANQVRGGFNKAMGLKFLRVTTEEVIAEVKIGKHHLQPYGLVHGGVYSAMIETLASTGAAISTVERGQSTVGLENSTTFLSAVRKGTLRGQAVPLYKGRRSHVWEATIHDEGGRLVAKGRVRLICLEAGAEAGGETITLETGDDTEVDR